jgi:hypothetical protein
MSVDLSELDTLRAQGTAVFLLDHLGKFEAADLLELASLKYQLCPFRDDKLIPHFEVDIDSFSAWTDAVVEDVRSALKTTHQSDPFGLGLITVAPKRVQGDWREARRLQRDAGISNQGGGRPLPAAHPIKHGLHFRSEEEVIVYDAWLRLQEALPDTDTIGIMPNCAIRVRGRILQPDFLITCRGRAAVLEVDGPHHAGRAAADRSRDQFLLDSGVAFVDRIAVEDVTNPHELEIKLRKFRERLLAR